MWACLHVSDGKLLSGVPDASPVYQGRTQTPDAIWGTSGQKSVLETATGEGYLSGVPQIALGDGLGDATGDALSLRKFSIG